MSTLTVNIPDSDLAKLREWADADKVTVEDEALAAFREYLQAREMRRVSERPYIIDRDELLRAAEALHRDMAARGVCISGEEINAAIKEARR